MTVTDLEQAQAELDPKEDLTPYEGQWVALREGRVIASDLDAVALRDNPAVSEDDALILVPSGGAAIFIL